MKVALSTNTPIQTNKLAKDIIQEIQTLLDDNTFPIRIIMTKNNQGDYTMLKELEFETDYKKMKVFDEKRINHIFDTFNLPQAKVDSLKNWCINRGMTQK